jgi:hypothetical protein
MERYALFGVNTQDMADRASSLDTLVDDMTKKVAELEDLGIVVKDLDYGLIDFPANRYGEKVLLCWRYGEPEVSFWHKPHEGFPRRKPLKTTLISR